MNFIKENATNIVSPLHVSCSGTPGSCETSSDTKITAAQLDKANNAQGDA